MSLTTLELADLLRELAHAEQARASADRAGQAATADATRAQAVLEAVQDGARLITSRNRELRASAQGVREALDRARLAALNAGLEGAKLGEPLGKAVLTMADDLRVLIARGQDALEEHAATLGELERERERWLEELSQTRELCAAALQRLRELGGLQAAFARSQARMAERLKEAIGGDAEREQLLAEASERAHALRESLGRLRDPNDPELRALLEPLRALLNNSAESP